MGKVGSKLGKVLKSVCTVMLICITALLCLEMSTSRVKAKTVLASDSEPGDTIIYIQERSRGRLVIDFVKKLAFIPEFPQFSFLPVQAIDFNPELTAYASYRQHVLYIYAVSEVP
jgi:hypothetical protein